MRVLIIGAGGHSREVADLVIACGHTIASFVDDELLGEHNPTGLPVVRSVEGIEYDCATIAVGDIDQRTRLFARYEPLMRFAPLIHPSACISPYAHVGAGTQVMQNVVVNANARVGENVILNVSAFIAHDCRVGPHSHIAPGAAVLGGGRVGERTLCGAHAVILPGVRVGDGCTIGAGGVVTSDVPDERTVVGVPTRLVER